MLVFDMKYDCFYLIEDFLPTPFNKYHQAKFTFSKDSNIYGIGHRSHKRKYRTEVRAFKLVNDRLVDSGVIWKGAKNSNYQEVTSACFV